MGSFVQTKVPESDPVEWQVQPIEWQVLHIDEDNNRVLIVSRYLLDLRIFDNTSNVWSTSSIRTWLNDDFYNTVFTDKEKGYIAYSELTDVGTTDNVFLLSKTEAEAYFASSLARRCTPTSYACSKYTIPYSSIDENTYLYWWLRSPSTLIPKNPYAVSSRTYDSTNDNTAGNSSFGIRPALWIDLNVL